MVLKVTSELKGLKRIVFLDGVAKCFKVLILKINFVESFVDSADILGLDTLEERSDESDLTGTLHDLNGLGQVDLGGKQLEHVVEEHWLFFKVEDNGTVPEIVVGNLDNVLTEEVVAP